MTARNRQPSWPLTPARMGRACALALGLIAAAAVAAQTPASGGKPEKPAAKKQVAPVDKPALEARAVDLLKATSVDETKDDYALFYLFAKCCQVVYLCIRQL